MQARCRGLFFLLLLPGVLISTGCRNKADVVEMELRNRETMYRELLEEQRRNEGRILGLQLEVEALRKGNKVTPEQAASTYGMKRIVLGRSTGGVDDDGLPGDEKLQVVVEPRDFDDHSIKAPGTLHIEALEITPQGIKLPLCTWDISAEQLRMSWKQGLLSTGYSLSLPWKQFPGHEQVRVVVRFVTPDQRAYEADKDVKVRVVPGAAQKRIEMIPEGMPICPLPTAEPGPILMPHSTQWRAPEQGITIGRPTPLNTP